MSVLLKTENLSVHVGDFLLSDINIEVGYGEIVVILGPSGAGKTVLLETIAGFHKPLRGKILLEGRSVERLESRLRDMAFVPQDCALFPHLNVHNNILFGARVRKMKDVEQHLERVVSLLEIDHLLGRNVETLSGGEAQRVAVARALMVRPKVLLVDEPFGALDPPLRRRLRSIFREAVSSLRQASLFVTHDLEEALVLGERVAVMRNGKIEQFGKADDVIQQPANAFVAELVGVENLLSGRVKKTEKQVLCVDCGGVEIRVVGKAGKGEKVHLLLRPENILVETEKATESSALNQIDVHIYELQPHGMVIYVKGMCGGIKLTAAVTPASAKRLKLTPGKVVLFSFKASAVHLIK